MPKYLATSQGPQTILMPVLVLASLGLMAGCATSELDEPEILASERLECQKAAPSDYEACLERARTGTVLHVPESVWQRDRKWNQRPFD